MYWAVTLITKTNIHGSAMEIRALLYVVMHSKPTILSTKAQYDTVIPKHRIDGSV